MCVLFYHTQDSIELSVGSSMTWQDWLKEPQFYYVSSYFPLS